MSQKISRLMLMISIFWLVFALLLGSVRQKSATVDEQSHLFRGVAYLRAGATQFLLGHPLGASALWALPVLTEPDLRLPVESEAWAAGDWSVAGDLFLWQMNDSPLRILFLGRFPVLLLTLLLGALVFRWGRELAGISAGLGAALLLLFDPNVLAHGRLMTGDLALTLFFTLTIYGYWKWSRYDAQDGRQWIPLLYSGAGLGLASLAKFNAALLLPILLLLGIGLSRQRRAWRPLLALLPILISAGLLIWAVNGFAWRPLPGGPFWEDLFWQLQYTGRGHGQYLFGQSSPTGWWYYFPVAFALKTPLPTLLLLAAAGVLAVMARRWRHPAAWFLLLPPLIYMPVSMTTALNIGVRYLLPILPFLYLGAAALLAGRKRHPGGRWLLAVTAVAVFLIALAQWPDYLPYLNRLAGDPAQRWRLLSDSNIDWGQDLPAVARWQAENREPLYLGYFGMAHPSAYGVEAIMLPTWAPGPEQSLPSRQLFFPPQPAPGSYAISVTNLHGVVLGAQQDSYDWFRTREPTVRLGDSIFIYDVPALGEPVSLALSGLTPAALAPELYAQLGSNDLQVRWYDAQRSFLWPADGGWAIEAVAPPSPALQPLRPETAVTVADQQMYRVDAPPADLFNLPDVDFGGLVALRGWQPQESAAGTIALTTVWEVQAETERPWKIFIHALDAKGEIVGQWDGLDVDPGYWKAGDIFVQSHSFAHNDTAVVHQLVAGMYDGETLDRLREPYLLFSME